jgi:hypothetical protein
MVFEPFWVRPLKLLAVIGLLTAAYAWTSADDWEREFEAEQPKYPPISIAIKEEPESEPDPIVEVVEPEPVFIPAPEGVVKKAKRAVSKAKRKVRQALKTNN